MRHIEYVKNPTESQIRTRKVLSRILAPVLRREMIHTEDNGLERAREAARNGAGTIIVWNHPTERDGFQIAKSIVLDTPELASRISVFPVSQHQDRFPLGWLQENAGFLYPFITTDRTFNKVRHDNDNGQVHLLRDIDGNLQIFRDDGTQYLRATDGLREYINMSQDALSKGGSVSISFQGGRADHLDLNVDEARIGIFLQAMKSRGVKNIGLLLVGIGERGRVDYDLDDPALRPFKKFTVTVGPYFTLGELSNQAEIAVGDDNRLTHARKIDKFIRQKFVELVPTEYLSPPNRLTKRAKRINKIKRTSIVIGALTTGAYIGGYMSGKKRQ